MIAAGFLGRDYLFVSAAEKNAIEALERCKRWIGVARQCGCEIRETSDSKTEIGINGHKILSLAQNPNTVRGFSGDVCLDELAFHAQSVEMYSAAFPITTHGYNLSVVSTPLGQSGKFYDIWSDANTYRDFSRHQTDIYNAVAQGLRVDIDLIRRNTDEETFRREYLCEFIDESTAYFPYDLILGCVRDLIRADGGRVRLGVDVGRKRDITSVCVLSELNERYSVKRMETLKGMKFDQQREVISAIYREENAGGLSIDATGIGMQLAEELSDELGTVDSVTFTNEIKEQMAVGVKRLLENRQIELPNDKDLIGDIHSIKRSVTPSGNTRFDADRTDKGHADRFWALALAVGAFDTAEPQIRFI